MNTKLTLRLDEEVIQRAKKYSKEVGKPVSRLVSDYFEALTGGLIVPADLPPVVKSLKGSLACTSLDEDDYRRYLEAKHG
jgi:hypothetical protein